MGADVLVVVLVCALRQLHARAPAHHIIAGVPSKSRPQPREKRVSPARRGRGARRGRRVWQGEAGLRRGATHTRGRRGCRLQGGAGARAGGGACGRARRGPWHAKQSGDALNSTSPLRKLRLFPASEQRCPCRGGHALALRWLRCGEVVAVPLARRA